MFLDRCGPVDVGMEQPPQPLPAATLDRVEHIAYGLDLLSHGQNARARAGNLHRRAQHAPAPYRSSWRSSAVDMQRWKRIGADPLFDAPQVCDPAMYAVDCEQSAAKHTYPHDQIGLPTIARHVVYDTLNPQIVCVVLSCVEREPTLPIYRSQLPKRPVTRAHRAHEAGEQCRRLRQFRRR